MEIGEIEKADYVRLFPSLGSMMDTSLYVHFRLLLAVTRALTRAETPPGTVCSDPFGQSTSSYTPGAQSQHVIPL